MPQMWIAQHDVHRVKTLNTMLFKQSQAALVHDQAQSPSGAQQ